MLWWENEWLNVFMNQLYLGNEPATHYAENTPVYVYNLEQITRNYEKLLHAFDAISQSQNLELRIHYAIKANRNIGILKHLRTKGANIDAVSPQEVEIALKSRYKEKNIIFTGVGVSEKDLESVFRHPDVVVTINSMQQLELMKQVRDRKYRNNEYRVAVRYNPACGRGFDAQAITAGRKSRDGTPIKFGVDDDRVIDTFLKAKEYGFVPLGLHQHLGSGWLNEDYGGAQYAVRKLISKAQQVQDKNIKLQFLDFGGGIGIRYRQEDEEFPMTKYGEYISQKLIDSNLDIKSIIIEPGRYLVGNAGVLLAKVADVDIKYGNLIAYVDVGTDNAILRITKYRGKANHEPVNCKMVESNKMYKTSIAGNLCESGDFFTKYRLMPMIQVGDIIAFLHTGAYCSSMASNYTARPIPRDILI